MKKLFLGLLFFVLFGFTSAQPEEFKSADSLNKIGDDYYWEEQYMTASEFYRRALEHIQKTDSVRLEADILTNLGIVYDYLGNYSESSAYLMKALELSESVNYERGIANNLNNIGNLNFTYGNYEEALNYFQKSLDFEKNIDDTLGIASSYLNIGVVYKVLKDYDQALEYYYRAEALYKTKNADNYMPGVYNNLGILFLEKEYFDDAMDYFMMSKEYALKIDSRPDLCSSYNNIADVYKSKKNFAEAEKYFKLSLEISEEISLVEKKLYTYEQLSEMYASVQDYKSSLVYTKKLNTLKDSVFNETKHKQFADLQTKYETNKKQLLIEKQDVLLQKRKSSLIWALTALFVFIALSGVSIYMFIKRNRAYKKIVEHNLELTKKEQDLAKVKEQLPKKKQKYSDSNLKEDKRKNLLRKIIDAMENDKLFLDKELTTGKLAELLETNKRYISEVINFEFETNFNNFINEYRIKEARQLLTDEKFKEYSLQGISEFTGFNNRATFNAAFKKFTGVTPSFFYKNINKSK